MHGYLPVACMASRNVCAGSRLTMAQNPMNSSNVGLPFSWSRRSMTLGALTLSALLTARSDGGSSMRLHASITRLIASLSMSVHSFASLAMEKILTMLVRSNTPVDSEIDKTLEMANIKDMLDTANENMTVGNIAIRIIEKTAGMKGLTQDALASKLGIVRQTVAARFRKQEMMLDDFIDTAQAIGTDPAQVIADAMQIKNTALAGKEE